MAVDPLKGLNRHAQESRRLCEADAVLHKPRRRRMAKYMRRHFGTKTGVRDDARKCFIHPSDPLAAPFDREFPRDALIPPPPQVRKQVVGQARGRLALLCLTSPLGLSIENTPFEIKKAMARPSDERRATNRSRASAGIKADQNRIWRCACGSGGRSRAPFASRGSAMRPKSA